MQNGFWAPMGDDYGQPGTTTRWMVQAWAAGISATPWSPTRPYRSYHGNDDGTGSPAPYVYRRDFEHGIAMVNVGHTAQKITLRRAYRHLSGITDRLVNNGTAVDHVTVPAQDGVILLDPRSPPPQPRLADETRPGTRDIRPCFRHVAEGC